MYIKGWFKPMCPLFLNYMIIIVIIIIIIIIIIFTAIGLSPSGSGYFTRKQNINWCKQNMKLDKLNMKLY